MPRYGFSTRGGISPFSSQDGVPNVTDEDYSYITSADLEDHGLDIPRPYMPRSQNMDYYSHSAPSPAYGIPRPEDDVMLIKYQGVTYPEHFPAYSIGDGKLLVGDVRERVQLILALSERQARRIKLYYKGRRLRDPDAPVREYGVKDNSEVLMVLGESSHGSSSESGEEPYVVMQKRVPEPVSPRTRGFERRSPRSPRDSSSQVGLNVPVDRRRAASRVRTQSPSGSGVSVASAPAPASVPASVPATAPIPVGIPGGPIEKLNAILTNFNSNWRSLCMEFITNPPGDAAKRSEMYRKLSGTLTDHVLIKFDGVTDVSTEPGARAWRKELVNEVMGILKQIDAANSSK